MAVKTKAQILSEIASLLADNTTGDISANDVRTVVNDITDSYQDIITAGNTTQYYRGDKTFQTLNASAVGLGNVTNNAQLMRDAGDFNTFTTKSTPIANDILLIEDSASSNAKKKITLNTLPTTTAVQNSLNAKQDLISIKLVGSLSSSDINTLDTSPIPLISAPGANKYIVIESASVHFKAGTSIFAGSYNLMLYYPTANEDILIISNKAELQSATDTITTAFNTTNVTGSGTPFTSAIINKGVELKSTGAISGGDGSINYTIIYRIVTTS